MKLPDPAQYDDPIKFLRAIHGIVLKNSDELERLAADAEQQGVFKSFAAHPEWNELLTFYTKAAPQHEKSEEEFLFPVLTRKLPRMGFQNADSPIRFLVDGHDVLQARMMPLVKAWEQFKRKERDPSSLEASAERHAEDDAQFVAVARELAKLYRDHITTEEEKVYSVADKMLGDSEREEILDGLRQEYDNEANTGGIQFDPPQFSNPVYTMRYRPPTSDED
jgi:hemerythrin-like domain-containing protein